MVNIFVVDLTVLRPTVVYYCHTKGLHFKQVFMAAGWNW